MIKKWFISALLLVSLAGCMYIDGTVAPEKLYTASSMDAAGLEKIASREMTKYGFSLFFISISRPKPIDMVDAMVVKEQAVGVTNLSIETSEFNGVIFQIPRVKIRADLVGKKK